MEQTPKANRVHIGFFGRCNVGKSTLINMLTDQPVSLVSEVAGTTTDPVSKSMEILPLGPVVITDTAGIDDISELGALRIEKSEDIIKKINLAVYVLRNDQAPTADDMMWLNKLKQNNVPIALFINEINTSPSESTSNNQNYASESTSNKANNAHQGYINTYSELTSIATVVGSTDFTANRDRLMLLDLLGGLTPLDVEGEQTLLQGLVEPGDTIILVCPIDSAAPKGRLILPQVQTIREILDHKGLALVCQTEELPTLLGKLSQKPKLVITDSQAFEAVNALTPADIPLTSFSILMARSKGDIEELVKGAAAIDALNENSRVLISEACTHAPLEEDIGRVKIPALLRKKYGNMSIDFSRGLDFPEELDYDLIIMCGSCMFNRAHVLSRIEKARAAGVPVTNYGVTISKLKGIIDKVEL